MLSPRTIHLFLKYFDSIDEALARRLVRKRTWDEEALTFLLTELLDEDSQQDHKLVYPHADLINDLSHSNEPLSINVTLETHSYPKSMECYVTQSDIGFILSYQDQFEHEASFRSGWLMQAKRLFPSKHKQGFTVNSTFSSLNPAQHKRMKQLRDWAGCDFIRYLLYCPRPSVLDKSVREHLSSARSSILATDIFDFALGLELRDDLLSDSPTVAAGIFVALLDSFPDSLLAVHRSLFNQVSPFSWFIVSQLARTDGLCGTHGRRGYGPDLYDSETNLNNSIVDGLIRGDFSVIQKDKTLLEVLENANEARILPAHTISIRVINGIDRPRNNKIG